MLLRSKYKNNQPSEYLTNFLNNIPQIKDNINNYMKTKNENIDEHHFQLHFNMEQYVLFETNNGNYCYNSWKKVSKYRDIKRIHYNTSKWKNYLIFAETLIMIIYSAEIS